MSPQQLRNVNVNLGATQANQSQQTHQHIQQQRPRSVPTIATSTINAKQLAARGLITSQRNIAVAPNTAQMKITTPITSKNKWFLNKIIDKSNRISYLLPKYAKQYNFAIVI